MGPIQIESVGNLLVQVSREIREHGWALVCTRYRGNPYQCTIGLQGRWQHPELEVVGLDADLGQLVLARLVARVKAGERFHAGDFFSDVLKGHDLFVVENPSDPDGPPVTGGRLRVIWPDARHRYPWQADCDPSCAIQSILVETDGLDEDDLQLLFAYTGRIA